MLQRQLEILGELAEDGLLMAKAIQRQVVRQADAAPAEEAPAPRADLVRAYAQAARAVRLALMQQAKLIQDMKAADKQDLAAPKGLHARKLRVLRIVKRAAQAVQGDEEAVERLVREAAERLDREDVCAGLLSQPTGEVVAHICRALGLSPDWPDLALEAWDEAERSADRSRKPAPLPPREMKFTWLPPEPAPHAASP
jgi:hypothetical protein